LKDVEKIPNLSDKIFLWISIARLLPNKLEKIKKELLDKAEEESYKLPSFLDTVERLNMMFFTLNENKITNIDIKILLEKFIKKINRNAHSPFLRENFQDILEVTYSVDPLLAKTFVNSFDSDAARINTGSYLNNRLNFLEIESKLRESAENKDSQQQITNSNQHYLEEINEKRLARLNSGNSSGDSQSPKELTYLLDQASDKPIYDSRYTFSYFIQRVVAYYENTEESNNVIRKSFLELLDVCNIVKMISIRNAEKIKNLLDTISAENEDNAESEVQLLKDELGLVKYNSILKLIENGTELDTISVLLDIDLLRIKQVFGELST
jgi:hypothetical protein